jgi:hypothetical protein
MIHNQNKMEKEYYPISFQNPIWNNNNSKTISCLNLN